MFVPGEEPIKCRRKRNDCKGCHHCKALDDSLVNVTRYELDVASRDVVLEAQRETRRHEGATAEQRATAYFFFGFHRSCCMTESHSSRFFDRVKSSRCPAKHSDGRPCGGKPKLMLKKEVGACCRIYLLCLMSRIGEEPRSPLLDRLRRVDSPFQRNSSDPLDSRQRRRKTSRQTLREQTVSRRRQPGYEPVQPHRPPPYWGQAKILPSVVRVVDLHLTNFTMSIGHPHIIKGEAVAQCPIVHRECPAKRTYYIPVDPTIRKILIFHPKGVPHNHPVPPPLKLSDETKSKYQKCIKAVGLIGSTVAKVDNGIRYFFHRSSNQSLIRAFSIVDSTAS
jgi:hypothetical protein